MKRITDTLTKMNKLSAVAVSLLITELIHGLIILGCGVTVSGDVRYLGTGIPYFALVAPIILIIYAVLMGRATKKAKKKEAFVASYVAMAIPFMCYLIIMAAFDTANPSPIFLPAIFFAMPFSSVLQAGFDILDEIYMVMLVPMLIPLIAAPLAYWRTKNK